MPEAEMMPMPAKKKWSPARREAARRGPRKSWSPGGSASTPAKVDAPFAQPAESPKKRVQVQAEARRRGEDGPGEDRIYLTPEQAAEYLHVSLRTLANWRCSRKGPAFRKHSRTAVVYVQAELDAWSEGQRVETVNEQA